MCRLQAAKLSGKESKGGTEPRTQQAHPVTHHVEFVGPGRKSSGLSPKTTVVLVVGSCLGVGWQSVLYPTLWLPSADKNHGEHHWSCRLNLQNSSLATSNNSTSHKRPRWPQSRPASLPPSTTCTPGGLALDDRRAPPGRRQGCTAQFGQRFACAAAVPANVDCPAPLSAQPILSAALGLCCSPVCLSVHGRHLGQLLDCRSSTPFLFRIRAQLRPDEPFPSRFPAPLRPEPPRFGIAARLRDSDRPSSGKGGSRIDRLLPPPRLSTPQPHTTHHTSSTATRMPIRVLSGY